MLRARLFPVFAAVLASGFVIAACSDDDDTSSAEAFIADYCNLMMPCCDQAGLSTDPRQCTSLLNAFTFGSTFRESEGKACIEAMRASSSHPDFCTLDEDVLDDDGACDAVFSTGGGGTVEPGGSCETDSDCADSPAGDSECHHYWENDASYQVCMILAKGEAGSEPCIGTKSGNTTMHSISGAPPELGYICDEGDGLYCDSESQRCVTMRAIGESCSYSDRCVAGAYCDAEDVCAQRHPAGSACSSSYGDECVESAYCDEASMTCKDKLEAGAACTASVECRSGWCTNDKCDAEANFGLQLLCAD